MKTPLTRRFPLVLAVLLLLPLAASAQTVGPFNQLGGPSPVSTQVSNTATQTNIASYTIPAGYLSSGRAHLKLLGDISTLNASPGTFTITAGVCGTTTTVVNAVTLDTSLNKAPFSYDLWLSPYGLGGTAQGAYLFSEWRDMKTASTETMLRTVARLTSCDTTINQSVTVTFQFGTADIGNGVRVESAVFSMGQ